jgi:hypothetical protein
VKFISHFCGTTFPFKQFGALALCGRCLPGLDCQE